ncbi:MAG TPA: hypothetical protein VFT46_03885 [Holophagaceae bacterium]|nr:hypothetical protein [Holophagaceae bacterium]
MRPPARRLILALAFGLALCAALPLAAQATRTWVSGVGDDANPGSRTAPCKTFAGAISKTAAGGEVDCLDPGGFGAVTITKSITLDGGGGQVASILVSGTNGLVINAGPNDVVILRHLRFNGIGTGLNGVRFLAGKALVIEDCEFMGFTLSAVDVALGNAGRVLITDTRMVGLPGTATSSGVTLESGSFPVAVSLDHLRVTGMGGAGVAVSGSAADLQMDGVWVSGSASGLSISGGVTRLSGCTLVQNTVGIHVAGGSIGSFGNNKVRANGSGNAIPGSGGGLLLGGSSAGGNLSLQ